MKIHRIVKLLNRRDISKVDKELRRQIAIKINENSKEIDMKGLTV
ncbi:MAG: hypothetical protein AB1567_09205 [bacterium]